MILRNARTLLIALVATLAVPAVASACGPYGGAAPLQFNITNRIDTLDHRIETGAQDGSLTRSEIRRLMRKQGQLKSALRRSMRNGRMSRGESRFLNRLLTRQTRRIQRLRSNRQISQRRFRRGRISLRQISQRM